MSTPSASTASLVDRAGELEGHDPGTTSSRDEGAAHAGPEEGLGGLVDIKIVPRSSIKDVATGLGGPGLQVGPLIPGAAHLKARGLAQKKTSRWKKVFSIRTMVILVSVLQVAGAVAVSWSVTYTLGVHNVETLSSSLIQGIHQQTRMGVTRRMEGAYYVVMQAKAEFEGRRLTKGAWRRMLEKFRQDLSLHEELDTSYVRFSDDSFFGVERCDNATTNCPTGLRAAVNNGTILSMYSADDRGQPLERQAGYRFVTRPDDWYGLTMRSPFNATWSRLRSSANPNLDPLANLVISFSAAIRPPQDIDERDGPVPDGIPGVPARPAPLAWLPASKADPVPATVGAVGANLPVGTLSSILKAAAPVAEAVVVITTWDGKMVAASTMVAEHILDVAKRAPIDAATNPSPLIRQMVASVPAGPYRSVAFKVEGREYVGGQGDLRLQPDLEWKIHVAVPTDVLLAEIHQSVTWTLIGNVAWLVVCVLLAAVVSWRIARPLLELRRSIARLVATMTDVTGELRRQAQGADGLPVAAAPEPQEAPAAGEQGKARGSLWLPWRSARRRVLPASRQGSGSETPWRGEVGVGAAQSRARRQSVALNSGLAELSAFQSLMGEVHSKFLAFQELSLTETALLKTLLAERKTKLEIEVREEETRKFLATMSHEMRTPLNGIMGMLDLARECDLPHPAGEYVTAAALSGEHLLALVNDVLDLQKIEAGAIAFQSVAMDPRLAVVNAVRIVQQRAADKGLKLSVSVDDRVPALVEGDPDRLRQVLLNLLSNAVKYTPHGGNVRVAAYVREGASGAGHVAVQFDIADTGPGIDEASQQQLFTRFFRVRQSPESDPGGTGLGLAISREIVERAGGQIGCLSTPGIGSKFWFYVPLRLPEGEAAGEPLQPWSGAEAQAARSLGLGPVAFRPASARSGGGSGPRASLREEPRASLRLSAPLARIGSLLVAEGPPPPPAPPPRPPDPAADNAVNAKVLETMLKREGYTVQVAHDGADAAARFEAAADAAGPSARAFDLIFMDCRMPGVDGYEATARIRALEASRGLPRHYIIALTANVSAADEARCLQAGMDCYMTKPIRRNLLVAKLREALGHEPAAASPVGTPAQTPGHSPRPFTPPSASLPPPSPYIGPAAASAPASAGVTARRGSGMGELLGRPGPAGGPKPGTSRRGSAASVSTAGGLPPLDVLVVDDVEMNRRVLSAFLASDGHRVFTASDGEDAVAAFEARARQRPASVRGPVYDAVFMDVQMPRLDGHGATRKLRALEAALGLVPTTVIACTAFSTSHDRDGVLRSGMDDYLTKPVSRSVILSTLTKWVSGRGRPPPTSPPPDSPPLLGAGTGAPAPARSAASPLALPPAEGSSP